jgi:hypothetical protein
MTVRMLDSAQGREAGTPVSSGPRRQDGDLLDAVSLS